MFFLLQCVKNLLLLLLLMSPVTFFFALYSICLLGSVPYKTHGFVDNLGTYRDMPFTCFPTEVLLAVRALYLMRVVEGSLDQFGLLLITSLG